MNSFTLTKNYGQSYYDRASKLSSPIQSGPPSKAHVGRLAFFIAFWVFAIFTRKSNEGALLTFPLFLIILSQVARLKGSRFISLDMIWFCALAFFVIAPTQSLSDGYMSNGGGVSFIKFSWNELIKAEIIVCLSFSAFILGRILIQPFKPIQKDLLESNTPALNKNCVVLLLASAVTFFLLYVVFSGGLMNVLASRDDKTGDANGILGPLFLAMHAVATIFLSVALRSALSRRKEDSKGLWFRLFAFAISSLLLLISANPLNMARFVLIASWFPVIMALFGSRVKYIHVYLSLFLGLVVAMPLMSISTRGGIEGVKQFGGTSYAKDVFLLKDIDVFDTLVYSVKMMENRDYYLGKNSLAIVLFFVPRSIWPDKPIVGGLIAGNEIYRWYGAGTPNLSYCIAGDFYMDFGYLGVVVGSLVIAFAFYFTSRSDVRYDGVRLSELVVAGSIPILVRGPVGAVVGYFVCLILAIYFYRTVFRTFASMK